MRIIPANASGQDERRFTRNAQRGRGQGNGQNNTPNNRQTGTENATRGQGRKDHERFAQNMRSEHNSANV